MSAGNGKLNKADRERVRERIAAFRIEEEARRQHAALRVNHCVELPDGTLVDELEEEEEPIDYTVSDLHERGDNTALIGTKKVGKSSLVDNLVRSLADEVDFLGQFPVSFPEGRVAIVNYELSARMARRWLREIDIENADRVTRPINVRGQTLPFWLPDTHEEFVGWLQENDVRFLILDPAVRAWHGLVSNENSNSEVGAFLQALDELKHDAGVDDVLLTHHTGWGSAEEGSEHGRGASVLEGWADALWFLSEDKDTSKRSLRALGRDVALPATVLNYDIPTRRLTSTGMTRTDARDEAQVFKAIQALADIWRGDPDNYPAKYTVWRKAIGGVTAGAGKAIQEAIDKGYVKTKPDGNAKLHLLTNRGVEALNSHEYKVQL